MSYKEMARSYFTAVNNYDKTSIERMIDENYIQHNPKVPTGRAAFLSLLPNLKAHESKIKNIRLLQDGQHVIMHHKWENAYPFGHREMAAFHIIRFNKEDVIAEHWSVMTQDISSFASGVSLTDGETQITDIHKTKQNREQIVELYKKMINRSETSHLLPNFLNLRFKRLNYRYQKQHKVFAEGNFVLSISEALLVKQPVAIYDLFRLENDNIVEHWIVAQEIPQENLANSNTMFGF